MVTIREICMNRAESAENREKWGHCDVTAIISRLKSRNDGEGVSVRGPATPRLEIESI